MDKSTRVGMVMSGSAKAATLAIKKRLRLCSKERGGEPGILVRTERACYLSASGCPLSVWRCDGQCRHGLPRAMLAKGAKTPKED
jgi:hypothetical protein